MEERFKVLAGQPRFLADRRWQTASPGEVVMVPAGVRHAYRNRGDEVVHMVCEARPPSSLQEFLEDAAALGRAGRITRHGVPKGLRALLMGAVMARHYRDMVVLLFHRCRRLSCSGSSSPLSPGSASAAAIRPDASRRSTSRIRDAKRR